MNSKSECLSAFHGSQAVRDAALSSLYGHLVAGRVSTGLFEWNGKGGSPAGCLIESADLQVWVASMGLPAWVPLAIDTLTSELERSEAEQKVIDTFHAIAPGSDLSHDGYRIIAAMLEDALDQFGGQAVPSNLLQALQKARALHLARVDHAEVGPIRWRQLRRETLIATAQHDEDDPFFTLAVCIEAAGWDPQSSPTAVAEVLRTRLRVESLKAARAFGWTPEDESYTQTVLNELYEKYVRDDPSGARDVFSYLAQYFPEHDERLRAYIAFPAQYTVISARRITDLFIELLRNTV